MSIIVIFLKSSLGVTFTLQNMHYTDTDEIVVIDIEDRSEVDNFDFSVDDSGTWFSPVVDY